MGAQDVSPLSLGASFISRIQTMAPALSLLAVAFADLPMLMASNDLRGTAGSSPGSWDGSLLNQQFSMRKRYDLNLPPAEEWDIIEIADKDLTHSCSNYVNDGTTVYSEDGKLKLKVSSACADGTCLNSGRVMSKLGFKYGLFTISATVPKCNGIWPALWLLPENTAGEGQYGRWPCSGEVDLLETVNDQNFGAFNIVAGYGSETGPAQGCNPAAAAAPGVCNQCVPNYCTSTTMDWRNPDDRYFVEDVTCVPGQRSTWTEHTFVLLWEPDRFVTWVDPTFEWDAHGKLVALHPKPGTSADNIPTWRMYHRQQTPTWQAVESYMSTCHGGNSTAHAPFDIDFKLVLNIAVGGYGGAPCTWGSLSCTNACGANVGAEMVVSDITVWQQ